MSSAEERLERAGRVQAGGGGRREYGFGAFGASVKTVSAGRNVSVKRRVGDRPADESPRAMRRGEVGWYRVL